MRAHGYDTDLKALRTPSLARISTKIQLLHLARGSPDKVAISAGGCQPVTELRTTITVIGRHVHKQGRSTVAVPCGGADARFPRPFVTRSKPTRPRSVPEPRGTHLFGSRIGSLSLVLVACNAPFRSSLSEESSVLTGAHVPYAPGAKEPQQIPRSMVRHVTFVFYQFSITRYPALVHLDLTWCMQ